ncbi:MAG: hypothetical protein ACXWCZ_10750 [Flavisolibacter sp.]
MKKFYFLIPFTFFVTFSFAQIHNGSNTYSGVNTDAMTCCQSSGKDIPDEECCTRDDSKRGIYIQRNATNHLSLVNNGPSAIAGTLMMHSIYGQLIISKNINLLKGANTIELPSSNLPQLRVVSFYVGQKLLFMQKVF